MTKAEQWSRGERVANMWGRLAADCESVSPLQLSSFLTFSSLSFFNCKKKYIPSLLIRVKQKSGNRHFTELVIGEKLTSQKDWKERIRSRSVKRSRGVMSVKLKFASKSAVLHTRFKGVIGTNKRNCKMFSLNHRSKFIHSSLVDWHIDWLINVDFFPENLNFTMKSV